MSSFPSCDIFYMLLYYLTSVLSKLYFLCHLEVQAFFTLLRCFFCFCLLSCQMFSLLIFGRLSFFSSGLLLLLLLHLLTILINCRKRHAEGKQSSYNVHSVIQHNMYYMSIERKYSHIYNACFHFFF